MPEITVVCVTYNSGDLIGGCLASLKEQTCKDFETIIIDNASIDGTVKLIDKKYPEFRLIRNKTNVGYCKAQNLGIKQANGKYILTLNPDIVLDKYFLASMLSCAESDPSSGSFSPKLLKLIEGTKTNIVDSLGHSMGRNRYVKNIGSGKIDSGQFEETKRVFGVSGAAAFYRKKMLESIKYYDEYLDEDFFMGYDDVDIDWRARNKGWAALYNPKAVAWHVRSATMKKSSRIWEFYNYRNRYLTIIKNDSRKWIIRHFFSIAVFEAGVFFSMMFRGQLLKVWGDVHKLYGKISRKRASSHGIELPAPTL